MDLQNSAQKVRRGCGHTSRFIADLGCEGAWARGVTKEEEEEEKEGTTLWRISTGSRR